MYDYSTAHNQTLILNSINNLNDSVDGLSSNISLGFGCIFILLSVILVYFFLKSIMK